MKKLNDPPTPIEVAEVVLVAQHVLPPETMMILRRMAYHIDKLEEQVKQYGRDLEAARKSS